MYQPLLDVDLTTGTITPLELPHEFRREWVGGTGLGFRLLWDHLRPGLRSTDIDCPVYVLTGPLTGTLAPQSSDWVVVTINGDLPTHLCASHAHGYFGARLRQAGWDGVILRGRSPEPTLLWIDGDVPTLIDATKWWGLPGPETDVSVREALEQGGGPVSVAYIGPAGENLVYGSSVRAEIAYGASQGGAGIAWGAKHLKGIAVRGDRPVAVADAATISAIADRWTHALRTEPKKTIDDMHADGLRIMPGLGARGLVPGRNFTDKEIGVRWGARLAEDLAQWKIESVGSWNCEMACHHRTECTTGPMAGVVASGYGGEVMEELGPNLGIEDPGVSLALNAEVDALGMGAGWVPRVIAMLMEAYEAGEISLEQTGGLELNWGNFEAVFELLQQTVAREGLGALVAQGIRHTARELGIEHRAVHMKGVGFNDHDLRAAPLLLFQSQIASGAGPTWQSAISLGSGTSGAEPDLDLVAGEPQDLTWVAEAVAKSQPKKLWEDSIGICYFATRNVTGVVEMAATSVAAATGDALTPEDAMHFGERLTHLQRLMLLVLGFHPDDDFDIAERMLEKLDAGPAGGTGITRPELEVMRAQYYKYLGWSTDTGLPSEEVLRRYDLSELATMHPALAAAAATDG
jgi:aldehyde:ferredoxin oxidoreductase